MIVFEFSYVGRIGGRDFEVPCVFVIRVRDGVIVESRNYGDHVSFARAQLTPAHDRVDLAVVSYRKPGQKLPKGGTATVRSTRSWPAGAAVGSDLSG